MLNCCESVGREKNIIAIGRLNFIKAHCPFAT